jgi:hypothetical protein
LRLHTVLTGVDQLGVSHLYSDWSRPLEFRPWLSRAIDPVEVTMPDAPALALLALAVEDASGNVLQRNFCAFAVAAGENAPRRETKSNLQLLRFAPSTFAEAKWSLKHWDVLDGLKVNGAGHGYFEYHLPWPGNLDPNDVESASLVFEASAKQLFGKDATGSAKQEGDFMLGQGTLDPSLNPNAYPMTDTRKFPSAVRVRVCGESAGQFDLPDDPADHRGILSWHAQKRDRKLREAGSYGYLIRADIPAGAWEAASRAKQFVVRFEVDDSLPGGLALYGEHFGRYPLDPTLILATKTK